MSLQEIKNSVLDQDQAYIAHPGYTIFDYQDFPPFQIQKAQGSKLYCADGRVLIDAIASWWCKPLGHQHPAIKQAIKKQLDAFEHVMFGQTTFDVIGELSEYLAHLLPGAHRVFYAGDGSTAVEVALKMSLQVHYAQGAPERDRFACLAQGYHGETLATLSLCDQDHFSGIYKNWVKNNPLVIQSIPYVSSTLDPVWSNAAGPWERVKSQLELAKEKLSAIILEPICQAPGGMKFYSQDFLKRLSVWAKAQGIHIIADEITTGFWRLGERLASDYVGLDPDFLCLGKALTGGSVAMSAVVFKEAHYRELSQVGFVHSNAYAGNALAAAAALASCQWMETHAMRAQVLGLQKHMQEGLSWIADRLGFLDNVRVMGGIAAAEVAPRVFDVIPEFAKQLSYAGSQAGVFLRPLSNTIYWCPPLIMAEQEVDCMITATEQALRAVVNKA